MLLKNKIFFGFLLLLLLSCSTEKKPNKSLENKNESIPKKTISLAEFPEFNADSAYHFTNKQVAFGPRVPNTKAHRDCAQWLEKELRRHGWSAHTQKAVVTAFNGLDLNIFNIVGRWDTANTNRILLFAHWDSRPFADRDKQNRNKPIDGANDGASGVGVLLEIARSISMSNLPLNVGIDIVFFDAEDYGTPQGTMGLAQDGDTWCLGSQYWAANPSIPNYKAKYGILLDMVGAADAVFPKEAVSMYYARPVVEKVWAIAKKLGYENYFIKAQPPGGITDDHLYINKIMGIPSIDIIHYEPGRSDFGSFHHTHDDGMELIEASTLNAVGRVVLAVLYSEE